MIKSVGKFRTFSPNNDIGDYVRFSSGVRALRLKIFTTENSPKARVLYIRGFGENWHSQSKWGDRYH